jgi:hypothetical protein
LKSFCRAACGGWTVNSSGIFESVERIACMPVL